jgi:class 3 adenylate cyclase
MEYTVIGDSVNRASRINSFAGPGDVVIGKEVYKRLNYMIRVEALGARDIKGNKEPVEIYRLLSIGRK